MRIHHCYPLLLCILFTLSCARQTTPTGGPKDSIPPTLILAKPSPQQTNFRGQQIELNFSESVQLNNPKEQIIITPDVGKDFDALVKKTKVIITLDKPLQTNTTYAISFRDAIQDITEKNPAQNLRLAFSTGDYIDSISVKGYIYELLEGKETKDATVALYQSDTFNIFKHRPSYLTKTNEKGAFHLENIKPGYYRIYAWKDNNKNLIVDSKSEAYGYQSYAIDLNENIDDINIPLINLDARPLKLTSARPSQTFYNIKLSKNVYKYRLTTPTGERPLASYGADRENIRIYDTGFSADSIELNFHAEDSLLNSIDTTLYVKFTERELKPEAFQVANNGFVASGTKGIIKGSLQFNKPLVEINYDSIYYRIDSLTNITFSRADIHYDTLQNILTFSKNIDKKLLATKPLTPTAQKIKKPATPPPTKTNPKKPAKSLLSDYQLYFRPHAFLSAESDSSKAIEVQLKPTTLESTGMIHIQLKSLQQKTIIQLLFKDKIVATKNSPTGATFDDLDPGDYRVRVIIDRNSDGAWSPGNYFRKEEPEPIVFYTNEKGAQTINLKANWELGPLLITF